MNIKITLGELVTQYPDTVNLLNQYQLDYCCGGQDTFEDAVKEKGLNIDILEEKFQEIISSQNKEEVKDWASESYESVINYILNTHHTFMKETLSSLNIMIFKLLKVHFKTHGDLLLELHGLFGGLKTELEAHLIKEEEGLFPLFLTYENEPSDQIKSMIVEHINETESEHDGAGDLFKAIRTLTNQYKLPSHVCRTFEQTYRLLEALEQDTFNHIHMENSVLFKMI